ncbi:MAG: prepilin-type N-terminal cleavage/methylation domain-containing protein [Sedimentisphaerales bacterium]|nr:prepilin-type N-terminal cleavage/methylation domain-containing protein [Sedimentisphaerales bacterium]
MCASRRRRGFSLVEILISIVLVGLSITALVMASNSLTMANGAGADLSTAEFLIEQIRELTTMLPAADPEASAWTVLGPEAGETLSSYDDVDDLNGFNSASLSGPINAAKTVLTDFSSFTQQVIVQKVNPSNLDHAEDDTYDSPFLRVTVTIVQNGKQISSASWIRAKY